jgi:short-subunit dehydrogenase
MESLHGRTALVTGSSGGIGTHIARALGRAGANVIVSGRREDALRTMVEELRGLGVLSEALVADLADLKQAEELIPRSEQVFGTLDVLVHNAGIELASSFVRYTREELLTMINVNLAAPLLMTRRALPGMLERRRGHVVFISSMAGKLGTAYQEPYCASKAGLIGLTQSLRAEYLGQPVGFSVICPGFVAGDGMYQRMTEQGLRSSRIVGATTTDRIADQVVRAIRDDLPEVVDSGSPVRPVLALSELAPRLTERLLSRVGTTELFRRLAASRGRAE